MTSARTNHSRWKKFARAEAGGIAILMAAVVPMLLVVSAVCIDAASLYLERRKAQGAVDLAAINAANNMTTANSAANATLAANNIGRIGTVGVVKGRYVADSSLTPGQRFKPGVTPYNAVQVTLSKTGNLYFAKFCLKTDPTISVVATAKSSAPATFSIGSRLASLQGGAANALLGALLGTNVQLSVMDYNSLADANVRVDDLLNSISSNANLKAATFNDVASSTVTLDQVLSAAAQVASKNGNTGQAAIIRTMMGGQSGSLTVPLSQFIDIGPYGSAAIGQSRGLSATLALLDVVRSAAMIANGDHQVSANLAAGLPGLGLIKIDLVVGERMQHSSWVTVGETGATVSTAQTKIRIVAQVLGSGTLALLSIRLPFYAEVAYATGTLSNVTCDSSNHGTVDISTLPGVLRTAIADVSDSDLKSNAMSLPLNPAQLISAPLLSVTASSLIAITNTSPTTLTFSQDDINNGVIKSTSTTNIPSSLVSSLLGSSNITVSGAGLGIALTPAVLRTALAPAAASLDIIVGQLLKTLGLSLGQADVQVDGVRCGTSNLAG